MELNILIDVQKTIEIYGYDPHKLKPNSEKLVVWSCSKCGLRKDKKFRLAQKNILCLDCSNKINANTNLELRIEKLKEWFKNNINPKKGIPRPDDVKEKIRQAHLGTHPSEETRQKLSKANSGELNGFYGKHHSQESLNKMREIQKLHVRRGKNSNFYGKHYHGKIIKYLKDDKIIYFRSTWELKTAEYFNKNNIIWEYEKIKIEFILNSNEVTYTPDFYLPETNTVIEVKGYWRDDAYDKYQYFIENYSNEYNIELWNKDKLRQLKII